MNVKKWLKASHHIHRAFVFHYRKILFNRLHFYEVIWAHVNMLGFQKYENMRRLTLENTMSHKE